jgi:hypothetical protein
VLFTVRGIGPTEPTPPVDRITSLLPVKLNCTVPAVPEVALNVLLSVTADATVLAAVPNEDSIPPVVFAVEAASEIINCDVPDAAAAPVELAGRFTIAELVLTEL